MAKRSNFTFEERLEIEKHCKTRMSYRDIAKLLNRNESGIGQEIKKNGGYENYSAKQASINRRINTSRGRYREFSDEEIKQIKYEYLECGIGIKDVCKKFKTSPKSLYIIVHGLQNKKSEDEDRFLAIEGQLDLLFEMISELQGKNE